MLILSCGVNIFGATCWNLVWSDEFNGSSINTANWGYDTGCNAFGNNEWENYTNSPANSYVSGGHLVINAVQTGTGQCGYTSARLTTHNKVHFTYGRIEASIKMPYGQGIWPAFWMLGENINTSPWPACGELDVVEMIGGGSGKDNVCYGTAHWADSGGAHTMSGSSTSVAWPAKLSDGYHVYAIEWDTAQLRWYFDGVQYYSVNTNGTSMEEFTGRDFYILFNLAVGGTWPGYPDGTTVLPQQMMVDYVRWYQQGACPATPTFTPTFTRTATPTPTSTSTPTRTRTPTPSFSPTYSRTPTFTITSTNTPVNTNTYTPTFTRTATPTFTLTNTQAITHTFTTTPAFTRTASLTSTSTGTSSPTATASSSNTPVNTATNTSVNTSTPSTTFSVTSSMVPTSTSSVVPGATFTLTRTNTAIITPTKTSQVTATNTPVNTVMNTFVNTQTIVPANTFTVTFSNTAVIIATFTGTNTPAVTITATPACTGTFTGTNTITVINTSTPTNTVISTTTPAATPDEFEIRDPVVYPNPYNKSQSVYFSFYATQACGSATLKIYTASFRMILKEDLGACLDGRVIKTAPVRRFNRLANGTYYYVITAENYRNKRTVSTIRELLIIK